jgi:hypothetical protein
MERSARRVGILACGLCHPALKRFQMLEASLLDPLQQEGCLFPEPVERFGTDLEMLRIAGLHIGLVERVESGALAMLVTRTRANSLCFWGGM